MPGSMTIVAIGLAVAAAVAVLLFAVRGGGSVGAHLARARESGDLTPLLDWIARQPASRRPDVFNRVIRRLWDEYERELATQIIRELAARHSDQRIAQYWLDQAQKVEPEIARRVLGRAFLVEHFQPEVAAGCGKFG